MLTAPSHSVPPLLASDTKIGLHMQASMMAQAPTRPPHHVQCDQRVPCGASPQAGLPRCRPATCRGSSPGPSRILEAAPAAAARVLTSHLYLLRSRWAAARARAQHGVVHMHSCCLERCCILWGSSHRSADTGMCVVSIRCPRRKWQGRTGKLSTFSRV